MMDIKALLKPLIERLNLFEKRLIIQEANERKVGTYTNEDAQDAVGGILVDSSTIDFTYSDPTPSITAIVIDASISTAKLANDATTFAKMQNIATDSLIGRDTASSGDPENILLNTTLSMDGTGNLQRSALTGDVTASAGSNATTIANNAVTTAKIADANVTLAKLANIATDSLIGRDTALSGVPENILLGASLSMDGSGNLQRAALTGDVTASANGNATTIAANAVTNAKAAQMAANTVKSNITGSTANAADNDIATVLAQYIHAATSKTTPADADELGLIDSAASNVLKKLTGTNLKAYLKTYFDTLYGLLAGNNTWTGTQAINNAVTITHSASALNVNRTTSSTTLLRAVAAYGVQSSGSPADGFGPAFFLQNQGNTIGEIGAYRDGADDTGGVILIAVNGGVAVNVARFTKDGKVIAGDLTSVGANILGMVAGTSSNDAAVGGVLYVDSGTHNNTTTGATDLATYTVPANTLAVNNQSLEFEAWGTFTNSVNSKSIKVNFGADTWTIIGGIAGSTATWKIHGRILRTAAATQDVIIDLICAAGGTPVTISTATRTLSGSNVLKLVGQGGASNEIAQEGFMVWFHDANT